MKLMKKILSFVVSLAMVMSLATGIVTTPVEAATSTDPTSSDYIKAFHLDCGRKYFSVAQIEAIIDTMASENYNTLELAIGNDGLRMLLDDMAIAVNGTTYTSDQVTAAIQAGNKSYSDQETYNELTESEMDTIISYAKKKGISIIPLVNTPGHMDTILSAANSLTGETLNYSDSSRTIDITNDTATAFTKALLQLYINYFANQGCLYFNMGCDEYANDIQSSPQFAGLISSGKYSYFVNYVNSVASMVKTAGMTPIAFNDGIYYNQNTSDGTFDTDIIISYWSSGWSGYTPASASYLALQGFKILNTNGSWYYVLNAANGTSFSTAKSNLSSISYDTNASTVDSKYLVGCMICYWCDTPSYSYDTTEQGYVAEMLTTFSDANDDEGEPFYYATTVDPDTGETDGTDGTDTGNTDTDQAYDKEIDLTVGESATETINPGNYTTSTSTVSGIADVGLKVTTVEGASTDDTTTQVTSITSGSEYYIGNGTQYIVLDDTTISTTTDITKATKFTVTSSSGEYTIKSGSYYLGVSSTSGSGSNRTRSLTVSSSSTAWTYSSSSGFYYEGTSNTYYLRYDSGWVISKSVTTYAYPYTYTAGETTEGYDYTTVTFTGTKAGTTYVTVGNTVYKVVVSKIKENVTVYVDNSVNYTDTTASTATSSDTSVATVSYSGNTLTIKGVKAGTTTVETTNCTYSVTVYNEDLTNVSDLTVEYWITNRTVTANSNTSIDLSAEDCYGNTGVALKDLVPETGTTGSDVDVFWKGTLLSSSHKQTTDSGDDETLSGTDFSYIRYYNGSWAVSDDGSSWTEVASSDQVVAYYLQKTEVTDEVTTEVVDWGPQKANWSDLNYLSTKYVLLDYTVKYESGEETPSTYPTSDTLAFHCDTSTSTTINGSTKYYRTLGMIKAEETADYEVYMITVTPTSDSGTALASTAANNTSYTYGGTETVAWAATEQDFTNSGLEKYESYSGTYKYTCGGEPVVWGLEILRQTGMKVTYYVRAKQTDDSLTVKYVNESTGEEFYNYNIAVKSGTTFASNIALSNGSVVNGSVTNSLSKTQTVSADLSTMPAIGTLYRYSNYTCTKLVKSDDSKTVTLYYNFNNTHSYVADFGLALNITADDLGITSADWSNATVTGATYGTATVDTEKNSITYTPTTTFKGVEQLSLTLTDGSDNVTHIIYIYPATTVYYEDGFAAVSGFKSSGTTLNDTQTTSEAGSKDHYGYDAAYADDGAGASNGTQITSSTKLDNATFSFKGTGVDIYGNSATDSGLITIQVRDADNKLVKYIKVDTYAKNGTSTSADSQEKDSYNSLLASVTGLEYGSYTIKVTHIADSDGNVDTVNIDGFKVYGTLSDEETNTTYVSDLEENPTYIEVRDEVLSAYSVTSGDNEQVYGEDDSTVAIVGDDSTVDVTDITDLLENGPKNELLLQPDEALVFKINTNRKVQVGLKALDANTTFQLNGSEDTNLNTSTDMFYEVLDPIDTATDQTVTIKNTGKGILSLTKIKVSDDPQAALATLSSADINKAADALKKHANATLTLDVDDKSVTLFERGILGEEVTFKASDIEKAAKALVKKGYELTDEFTDVTMKYGDNLTISFTSTAKTPKSVVLSKEKYTYNGKSQKPTVTVTDTNGNVVDATNYTVTYDKDTKSVGTHKVVVTFNGDTYVGTKELTYTIVPKGTTISKAKAYKGKLKVYVKKQTTATSGYEIQYSKSSKFTSAKTVTISTKYTSKTITKLSKKTKYYVRVRTYKTVNGKKVYSSYSSAKSYKTK